MTALAVVVSAWDQAPHPAGTGMVVFDDGRCEGALVCEAVDAAVAHEATKSSLDGEPRRLRFVVSNRQAWDAGLTGGGKVEIFVAPMGDSPSKRAVFERLERLRAARTPAALVVDLSTGLHSLIAADLEFGAFALTPPRRAAALRHLAEDRGGLLRSDDDDADDDAGGGDGGGSQVLLVPFNPPLRLALQGGGPVAAALASLAAGIGFEIVDAGRAAADARTAVVSLVPDPQSEDPALIAALRSPAFYVGAMGDRRTSARRLERLRDAGLSEARLARLRAPAGLAIETTTSGEAAAAILTQIIATLRRRAD